jgi:hypothetical protein
MNFQNDFLCGNLYIKRLCGLLTGIFVLVMGPVGAEIQLHHPSSESIVFSSPETQQTAIQPPEPVFIHPPSRDREVISTNQPLPTYYYGRGSAVPPRRTGQINTPSHPSNQEVVNHNLQRAHTFSQDLFDRNSYANRDNREQGTTTPFPYWYGYYGAFGLTYPGSYYPGYYYPGYTAYPPPRSNSSEFNQSSQPSNRDITTYNINRAHQFSSDNYRTP